MRLINLFPKILDMVDEEKPNQREQLVKEWHEQQIITPVRKGKIDTLYNFLVTKHNNKKEGIITLINVRDHLKIMKKMRINVSVAGMACLGALVLILSGCGRAQEKVSLENTKEAKSAEESIDLPIQTPARELTQEPIPEPTQAPTSEPRLILGNRLQVIGPNICDAAGAVFQLRGISTHGIQWYPQYINQELFTQIHDEWNCNVIRIANYVEEYDGYCTGGNQDILNQLIDEAVTYATQAGLYVIIDWHVMKEGDPRIHQEEAIHFFEMCSKKYADNPYVLYEICNEPNGIGWDAVSEYANAVIPIIRQNSPYSVIIVGTPMYSSAPSDPLQKPLMFDNLVYAYHFYARSHRQDRQEDLRAAYGQGLPILVSEFGTVEDNGSGESDDEMADQWISILDECGIGYICWNLSNKDETSALIVSECEKISGFTTQDLKPQGQWLLHVLEQ